MREMKGRFVIIGDLNFPGIRWATGGSDAKGRAFYDSVEDGHMTQHVVEPTHISGNLLDLVISSDENMTQGVQMEGRLATSDHELIEASLILDVKTERASKHFRNFAKGDYDEMRRRADNIQWDLELMNLGVEDSWCFIKRKLLEMMESLVPMTRKRGARAPPWMDGEVRRAIREKKKAWKEWKTTKREEAKRVYKNSEKRTKKLIRNRKNAFERHIAKDCKLNPKRFYSFINSARRSRSTIGPLNKDGERVVAPKEQADFLSDYFSSVFDRCQDDPPTKEPSGTTKISDIEVNEEIIKDQISRLHEHSTPGPDDISNKVLIELKNEIAYPLAVLFTKSLDESRIPADWRLSNVTPVFKKGSKADPGNYRP
jgi:hypothetical protein